MAAPHRARPDVRRAARRAPLPGGSAFELWSWLFMRLSGLALLFLALGHLAIMHLINTVDTIDYAFVADRWAHIGWRTYDMTLLLLALLHGANGMRVVIDDYVTAPRWHAAARWTLYGLTAAFTILGGLVILTFSPVPGQGGA